MAQLYTILYLNHRPMSLDDMAERLKISKGSASINIRALERYGAVRRVWVKGSRRDYYESEVDISKIIIERARHMITDRLSEVSDMINKSYNILNAVVPADANESESVSVLRERLEKIRNLYDKANSLSELFNAALLNDAMLIGPSEAKKEQAYSGNVSVA